MVSEQELKKYDCNISVERLKSYLYSQNDTLDDAFEHYVNHILIAQSFYPELFVLEVALRNAIDTTLKTYISDTWIEDEVNNNKWLRPFDYKTLKEVYDDTKQQCIQDNKTFTTGKIISNLTFGFWTGLCVRTYNGKIWNKKACFKSIFPNYHAKQLSIGMISQQLYQIRRFRNRVFHYEQVFKNPQNTLKMYNDIMQVISYLPGDNARILKKTSTFLNLYNSLLIKSNAVK